MIIKPVKQDMINENKDGFQDMGEIKPSKLEPVKDLGRKKDQKRARSWGQGGKQRKEGRTGGICHLLAGQVRWGSACGR